MIVGIVIGILAVICLQGIGLMLTWRLEHIDDAGEAVGWWYALTAWPLWLGPYLRERRVQRRPHDTPDLNE